MKIPARNLACVASLLLSACESSPSDPVRSVTCATPVSLRAGEVRELRGAAALSCFVAASADITSDYVFIAANATATQDDVRQFQIDATIGRVPVAQATAPSALPDASRAARHMREGRLVNEPLPFAIRFEGERRAKERRQLGDRSLSALGASSRQAMRDAGNGAFHGVAAAAVGDTLQYRMGNAATSNLCTNFTTVRAVVRATGQRAVIVQDVNAPAGGFSEADFAALAQEFDQTTYPTVAGWFGIPTDINGDGRITILVTPEINRLTPTGSLGFAGGFFFMSDLIARSIPSQGYSCPASNEQEILYLLAPDVNGQVNGNRFSVETARESARGTMAHEMQHMINQGIRQSSSGGAREVAWLDEGLSHFAEEAVGRASRGYSDGRRLRWNDVLVDLDDFDSYFRQNLLRHRLWLDRPDLASAVSSRAAFELAPRGAAWALVRFAIDQYGGNDPRAFTRALVAGPAVDIANLNARAGVSFDRILPGFLVANYGDVETANFAAVYRFSSWDIRDVMTSLNGGIHPLRLASFPAQTTVRAQSGSGSYFFVSRAAGAEPATFRTLSPGGQPLGDEGARVYVTRVR